MHGGHVPGPTLSLPDPVQTPISLDNGHIVSYISAKCVTYNFVIVYIGRYRGYRGLDRVSYVTHLALTFCKRVHVTVCMRDYFASVTTALAVALTLITRARVPTAMPKRSVSRD